MTYKILHGNNLDILPTLADNSIDSIVTDPPYELGFMGKKWDSSGIAYSVELWQQCLRVLKPGGHLLSFGGTRTWHRVAVAIEDAGFEIRDNIARFYGDPAYCQCELPQVDWVYGTGEPQAQHSMRPMPDGNLSPTIDPANQQGKVLQSEMQEQGTSSTQGSEPKQGSKDGKESSLEGRGDLQATQGQLFRCEVCQVSDEVSANGEERRLHHGTQACGCKANRQDANSDRSSESQGPQSQQQSSEQSGTVPNQRGSQERRGWPICVGCGKPVSTTNAGHMAWVMGSGFPKSLDVSKAIDKAAGAEREVLPQGSTKCPDYPEPCSGHNETGKFSSTVHALPTSASTLEAQQWQGWGTALKPAFEPIVVARKPIEGTVANNVLKHGTGGLNIDGSRIGSETISTHNAPKGSFAGGEENRGSDTSSYKSHTGRWPANILLDEHTAQLLDEQSGISKSGTHVGKNRDGNADSGSYGGSWNKDTRDIGFYDSGGASRFFYVAKASKRDRNEGLDELPEIQAQTTAMAGKGMPLRQDGTERKEPTKQNFHPTVKPTTLMEYLIKLVTPPGGTVLDPFTGSGSTGKAAILQGFDFIGIEMTEEYLPIIKGRLKHAEQLVAEAKEQDKAKEKEVLF